MRLITWNCKAKFSERHRLMSPFAPDILVVPEAEQLRGLHQELGSKPLRSILWFGENPRKGMSVVAYGDYSLVVHPSYVNRHKWIVPVNVSGPTSFLLFAVWTLPVGKSQSYVLPLMEALETYKDLMDGEEVIWAGDFNANDVFDRSSPSKKYRWLTFVASLEKEGIKSVYHQHHGCISGGERHPTHYHQHNMNKPFHIDYVLASDEFKCVNVEVGPPEEWIGYSDHMPLICDFQ